MTNTGLVSPLVHLEFYPQENPCPATLGAIREICWLVKTVNKAAATGIANLPAAATESNAEEWCSAVDIGGKEGFIKISSEARDPYGRFTRMFIAGTFLISSSQFAAASIKPVAAP
jgi:hypothetical protein